MKTLLKNGRVVDVFNNKISVQDVLIDGDIIIGVGENINEQADVTVDLLGKFVCPGFIDGHIHIESTLLSPPEFAKAVVPHGTTTVVADPHEIANVCGKAGIEYMLNATENLPLTVYFMMPSCVPATPFCESGAVLEWQDIEEFYSHERVLGLGEVMNYVGVINKDPALLQKINSAKQKKLIINGHAPLLSGKDLDDYISAGIGDDHECSNVNEALEKAQKGQWIMIRQGTAAKNLKDLSPLFDSEYSHRCMLVTDDKCSEDLLKEGHLDNTLRLAVGYGKDAITAIKMATVQVAERYGLKDVGAIYKGYKADIVVLEDLQNFTAHSVYKGGIKVAEGGRLLQTIKSPKDELEQAVRKSFNLSELSEKDFIIDCNEKRTCRVIGANRDSLITDCKQEQIDFSKANGIDVDKDLLKIAVIERHNATGHIGLGFIAGIDMKSGAIASSVSHDSHNLVIIGTNEKDMAIAGNKIRELGGGNVVVKDGKVLAQMPLPIAGLTSDKSARTIVKQNKLIRESLKEVGIADGYNPFMLMSFVGLPVIPYLKLTTKGLIDVANQIKVSLFV